MLGVGLIGFCGYMTSEVSQLKEKNDQQMQTISSLSTEKAELLAENDKLNQDKVLLVEQNTTLEASLEEMKSRRSAPTASRGYGRTFEVECTAYTLGGNTASGFSLSGLSREEAMVVAVDPNVIPLGTQIYLEFDGDWSHYNGVYTASDTGGAISGNVIDVFVGHGNDGEAMSFGRRSATASVL